MRAVRGSWPGRATAVVLALLFAAAGCRDDVAARVGSVEIRTAELRRELEVMAANADYVAYLERTAGEPVFRDDRFISSLVAQVLTIQMTAVVVHDEFVRRKLRPSADELTDARDEATAAAWRPAVFERFPSWYREILLERAVERVALRRLLVADETPESYFAEHRDEFVQPCTRDIVVATEGAADIVRDRIRGGEPFADVARDASLDTGSAPRGGDLGCNNRDDLKPELNAAVAELALDEISEPIRTDEGYHVLVVYERRSRPLDVIRNLVTARIQHEGLLRLDRLVKRRFGSLDVEVGPAFGTWTGEEVRP